MIRAIVTDIEGTTSSISFVKDVLFPYAREHLPGFVRAHAGEAEVRRLLADTAELHGAALDDEAAIAVLVRWIDEDRKATPLKALQGLIWEAGYRSGDFHGHVYPDAERKLKEWKASGLDLYVYSSGSVYAQKLLFGHTDYGDLTPLFSAYFDTRVGAKQEAESYRAIAREIGLPAGQLLFLSDIVGELDAAREAGYQTCQLLREGASPGPAHIHAADFDEVILA
ncbi:acireductone synthase [Methylococcus sp. EFPC2]|uniref:acireductone synthase n=1 Tax=Methylococcus sp. EFPC2 TaxID=2812648 RepID=UPI001968693E|nr:acireductone synthase [Methylococcus sp. EFPC2]QSA97250.1 acireductone synthase [Methylococcus sp. EFPC2]